MADIRAQKKKLHKGSKASARKRARQALKHKKHNYLLFKKLLSAIKRLRVSLTAKNKSEAFQRIQTTLPLIAKMASKGILHKNTAARYTSRLMHHFNQLS